MGAVDLVIQVESPKSVARGLQRIGRAGHDLGAVSKGRIFPKFRADLLESAVVARAMREGDIEETKIPRNPLDVLAQQIVAIASDEEISSTTSINSSRVHTHSRISAVRSSRTCSTCSPGAIPPTSSPSCGRASSGTEPAGRSARATGRGGSQSRTPARFPTGAVRRVPRRWRWRVGELDEEMVYEARAGQTFLLGASTWRIEEITRDRVLVSLRRACRARCRSGRAKASAVRSSSGRRSVWRRASSRR